jgi:hypothetical protein
VNVPVLLDEGPDRLEAPGGNVTATSLEVVNAMWPPMTADPLRRHPIKARKNEPDPFLDFVHYPCTLVKTATKNNTTESKK